MRLFELESEDPLYVMYVTCNPPTNVYKQAFDKLRSLSRKKHVVFINSIIDTELNPLSHDKTRYFATTIFKGITFAKNNTVKSMYDVLDALANEPNVVMVVPNEDIEEFKGYSDYAEEQGINHYGVMGLNMGKDTSDEESQKALSYVSKNQYKEFKELIPYDNEMVLSELYLELRKRMMISPREAQADNTVSETIITLVREFGKPIVTESLSRDRFGSRVIETDKFNIVEMGNTIQVGTFKNKPVIAVKSLSENYLIKNRELLETVTSGMIANTTGSMFSSVVKRNSVDEELKNESSDIYEYLRLFVNKHGYLDKSVTKLYKESE